MCNVCQQNKPLQAVNMFGRTSEPAGHYILNGRQLMVYDVEDRLRDRLAVRFCPECGSLLEPDGVHV